MAEKENWSQCRIFRFGILKSNLKVTLKVLLKVILDGTLAGGTSWPDVGEPIGAQTIAPPLEAE